MAVPKLKLSELSKARGEILSHYAQCGQFNELAYKKLESELKDLCKMHDFEGSARVELGLLQAMRFKYDDAMHNIRRAGQIFGAGSKYALLAEINAKLYCWDVKGAYECMHNTDFEMSPESVRELRIMAMHAGMFCLADKCNDRLSKMNVDLAPENFTGVDKHSVEDIRIGAEIIRRNGLTDFDISELTHVAAQVVSKYSLGKPFVVYGYSVTYDAGLLFEFPLDLPVDKLVEIDWEISSALVDTFEDPLGEVIAFSTKPFGINMFKWAS